MSSQRWRQDLVIDIGIHFILLVVFISVTYHAFLKPRSARIITEEFEKFVDEIVRDIPEPVLISSAQQINIPVANKVLVDCEAMPTLVLEHNRLLLIANVIVPVIACSVTMSLLNSWHLSIWKYLFHNIAVFIIFMVIEVYFILQYSIRYIPTTMTDIVTTFFEKDIIIT